MFLSLIFNSYMGVCRLGSDNKWIVGEEWKMRVANVLTCGFPLLMRLPMRAVDVLSVLRSNRKCIC